MPQLLDDASLPTDAAGLQEQLHTLEKRLHACTEGIKRLMAEEDYAAGLNNAAAIHKAKQMLMMLRYQHTVRKNRLRQLPAE